MNEQIETVVELSLEDLDQVHGGIITCRKAGGDQQEYLMQDTEKSIIVVC